MKNKWNLSIFNQYIYLYAYEENELTHLMDSMDDFS